MCPRTPDHRLFEYAALLEEVLAPPPKVRIVLSTSWVRRYRGSIARVTRGLTPALRARVVGRTYHSRMDQAEFASSPSRHAYLDRGSAPQTRGLASS